MAPIAVTPDELSSGWAKDRVHLNLRVDVNGTWFGEPNGSDISFSDLIAHAAATRSLCAGTIIGSGTVSNPNYRVVGSTCIAERRAIETLDTGAPRTEFLRFGDRVRMTTVDARGGNPFGTIDQQVVNYRMGVG
jgi:fumarylacetoacetate (FAA) hydrolase